MTLEIEEDPYLAGQLLLAMPGMEDERFSKTVIYVCAHNGDGAMGLVINQPIADLSFNDLLEQLNLAQTAHSQKISVQSGGPVEQGRGFVLHGPDYQHESTMVVNSHMSLTGTIDILKDIAEGQGPKDHILALGYAGWGPGQLDSEILANGWLTVDADEDIVFNVDVDKKWESAMGKLGIDLSLLSEDAGHA
ncbi:MAG: YqgE/AlgH family protein [Magnetovibrio sp.]|nr:YqgE/AlgH family protein [Magnetovibrio sp.]